MNMTQSVRASMLAVALAALTSQAVAGKPDDTLAPPLPSSVTVHFNDLDVSTPAGGRALLARINNAASQVCHTTAEWYPTNWRAYRECVLATVDHVVSRLNLSQLTAAYERERPRLPVDLQARSRR